MHFFTLFSAAALIDLSIAGYVLKDDYMNDFYSNFDFFTGPDPTEGFVNYVDQATAISSNLISSNSTASATFGVDSENKTPQGRPAVRLTSKKSYNSGLIILDVAHMPFGCGTWPAFWTVGPSWPTDGEIDILEGVNEYEENGMTLHTGPGCRIGQDTSGFSGDVSTGNCDVAAEDQAKNVGCSIKHPSKQSYGAGLNAIGGGVYATQWTSDAISIFFFPRNSIPADVLSDSPNPEGWGLPSAKFSSQGCDIEKHFVDQRLVFTNTFCGQWAGAIWEEGSCAKKAATCEEYVRDNPEAFANAYWEVNGLKVYQDDGKAPNIAPPSSPAQSSAAAPPAQSTVVVPPAQSTAVAPPAPAPTDNFSYPAPPPESSQAPPAVSSIAQSPDVAVPAPTSAAASASAPAPPVQAPPASRTQNGTNTTKPTNAPGAPISAPTGIQAGMADHWQWPVAGDAQKEAAAPPNAPAVPSTPSNVPAVPAVPQAPAPTPTCEDEIAAGAAAPMPTVKMTSTRYNTVFVTVPARAAQTPATASAAPPAAPPAPVVPRLVRGRNAWA